MAQLGSLSNEMEMLSHILSLVQAFRAFDGDNDGSISAAELGGIMGSLGYNPSEQDVRVMMQKGDTDEDGRLSIEEFLEMNTNGLELGGLAGYLGSAFEVVAATGNEAGVVTGEVLHEALAEMGLSLSLEACHDIIASMDEDGDGAVSFEEFKLIVNSIL
ncbi:hypothetical protein U1Q18_037049 [Sarracenia purpurea var. burkii]